MQISTGQDRPPHRSTVLAFRNLTFEQKKCGRRGKTSEGRRLYICPTARNNATHACFSISHVRARLSMVSYAFQTPNRARCKFHAVKSNKVRSKLMLRRQWKPRVGVLCETLRPTSLPWAAVGSSRSSKPMGSPTRSARPWGRTQPAD